MLDVTGGRGVPGISGVILSYNYGRYLTACVESVLRHTGVALRILIDPANTFATLADEPLRWTCRADDTGIVAERPVAEWLAAAQETAPDPRRLRYFGALRHRQRLGETWTHRSQAFASTGAARWARNKLWWRCWERAGG